MRGLLLTTARIPSSSSAVNTELAVQLDAASQQHRYSLATNNSSMTEPATPRRDLNLQACQRTKHQARNVRDCRRIQVELWIT